MIKLNQFDTETFEKSSYITELSAVLSDKNNITLGGIFNLEIIKTQNLIGDHFKSNAILCSSGTSALLCSIEYAIDKANGKNITWVISEFIYFSLYSFLLSRKEKIIFLSAESDEVTLKPVNLSNEQFCIFILTNHNNLFTNLHDIVNSIQIPNRYVIEDCCLMFDNSQSRNSDVQCYSFSNNKLISAGEGGCVVSKDTDFLSWFKYRTFSNIKPKIKNPIFMYLGEYRIDKHFSPYKCSINIMTSLLIKHQLENINFLIEKRRKNYDFLYSKLKLSSNQFETPNAPLFYPLWLPKKLNSKQLKLFQLKCLKNEIQTSLGVLPYYYFNKDNVFSKNLINLPVHSSLTISNLEHIVYTVNKIVEKF